MSALSELISALEEAGIPAASAARIARAVAAVGSRPVISFPQPSPQSPTTAAPTPAATAPGRTSVFNNPVQFGNEVVWGGVQRQPADVDVITLLTSGGPVAAGKLAARRRKVAVLNDWGDRGWSVIGATFGATSAQITATGTVEIVPNFTTGIVYSVDSVSFDPETCDVTVTSSAVSVINGWSPAVTATVTMNPTNIAVFVGRTDGGPGSPGDRIVNLHVI